MEYRHHVPGRRRTRWISVLLFSLPVIFSCSHSLSMRRAAGLTIYFVRHAETAANATGEKTPENMNTFSEKGLAEIAQLTQALQPLPIDAVLVSPTYRTEHTVLPYLREKGIQAEIWPELEEWHMLADPMSMRVIKEEQMIRIAPEDAPYFRLRDAQADKRIVAKNYEGGLEQIHKAARLINERFGKSGKTILIVGHVNSGSRLLEVLMHLEPVVRFKLEQTKLTELVQNSDGHYTMRLLNGKPYSE